MVPDCVGAGVFEGRINGKSMTGTIVDLSDGSTSVVTLKNCPTSTPNNGKITDPLVFGVAVFYLS